MSLSTDIRQATIDVLKASRTVGTGDDAHLVYATAAEDRIFDSRSLPLQDTEDAPILIVFTAGSEDDQVGQCQPVFDRTERIRISGEMFATAQIEDDEIDPDLGAKLDDLEEQVKVALFTDLAWMGRWKHIRAVPLDRGIDDGARRRTGGFSLTIEGKLRTFLSLSVPADAAPLQKVDFKTDIGSPPGPGPDGRIEAEAVAAVPQPT